MRAVGWKNINLTKDMIEEGFFSVILVLFIVRFF